MAKQTTAPKPADKPKQEAMHIVTRHELPPNQKLFKLKLPETFRTLTAVKKDWGGYLYIIAEHGAPEREYHCHLIEEHGVIAWQQEAGRYEYLYSFQENVGRADRKSSVYHLFVEK